MNGAAGYVEAGHPGYTEAAAKRIAERIGSVGGIRE